MFGFCLTPHPSSFSLSLNVVFLYWCAKAMCWNFVSFFFFFQFHFTVIKKAGYSLIFVVSSAVQQVVRYISPGCNWWMIQLFRSELQIAVGLLCCTSSPRSESLELKELIVCKEISDFSFPSMIVVDVGLRLLCASLSVSAFGFSPKKVKEQVDTFLMCIL